MSSRPLSLNSHSEASASHSEGEDRSTITASSGADQSSDGVAAISSFGEKTNRVQNYNLSTDTRLTQKHSGNEPEDEDYGSDNDSVAGATARATKKIKWTEIEDSRLKAAVAGFLNEPIATNAQQSNALAAAACRQAVNWGDVASRVPNRTAKQCRERWCYNLDPSINHGPFTLTEDAILLKAHRVLGNQWAAIAKLLPSRTENAVKTRHKSVMRAQKREWKAFEDELLIRLYEQFGGGRWSEFVGHFDKRTANALKTRFAYLKSLSNKNTNIGNANQLNVNLTENYPQNRTELAPTIVKESVSEGNVRQVWLNPQLIETVDLNFYSKKQQQQQANVFNSAESEQVQTQVKPVEEVNKINIKSSESQAEEELNENNNNNEVTIIEENENVNVSPAVTQRHKQNIRHVPNNNFNRNVGQNNNFQNLNTLSNLATFQSMNNINNGTFPNFQNQMFNPNAPQLLRPQNQQFHNNNNFQQFHPYQNVNNNNNLNQNKGTGFDDNCNKAWSGVSLFQEAVLNDTHLSVQEKMKFSERSYSLSIDFFEAKKRKLQNNNNNNVTSNF